MRDTHNAWFVWYRARRPGPLALAVAAVFVLALAMIILDIQTIFARTVSLPVPQSLLIYPLAAVLAEVLFHAAPLAALIRLFPATGKGWKLVALAALPEVIFQFFVFTPPAPWVMPLVLAHVYTFNVVLLVTGRRYGFAAMLGLRILYYLIWHIAWGAIRLQLLF